MPKHPGRYQEIIDWHNAVVAAADRAQSRVDSSLIADSKAAREGKIAAVNQVLTKALKDLMGGGDLDDDVKGKIATFSKEMVEKGVTSFNRVGEGEAARKAKKLPNRLAAALGVADKDATFSDFMKHQYNAAKDEGVVSLPESRHRSESVGTVRGDSPVRHRDSTGSDDAADRLAQIEADRARLAGNRLREILDAEPTVHPRLPMNLPGLKGEEELAGNRLRAILDAEPTAHPRLPQNLPGLKGVHEKGRG